MQGYVALHRKLMDSWVSEDPMALALWVRMLMEASHKKRTAIYRGENYELEKGGFLFGLNKWVDKTGIPRETIRKRVDMLESDGMITRQKHPHISVITVSNWELYQRDNTAKTQQEHGGNTAATRQEQQNNNGNNVDNANNGNKTPAVLQANNSLQDEKVTQVFDYWLKTMGKDSRAKLTAKRRSKIEARFKEGFTVDDICLAIHNCASSAFHMGQNDTGAVHDDLELICRNDGKLQFFMKMQNKKPANEDTKAGYYDELQNEVYGQ